MMLLSENPSRSVFVFDMEPGVLFFRTFACLFGAIVLYLNGRSKKRDADILKRVTRVNQLNDLSQLLDSPYTVMPLVVAISGKACSDKPISCKYSKLQGVIVKETKVICISGHKFERQIKDKGAGKAHNGAGSWGNKSKRTTSFCRTVPWYLDDGTSRVNVVEAQYASGFEYTVKKQATDRSGRSLVTRTLDNGLGVEDLVISRTEEVLPIGTQLTVVGQAVKDCTGRIQVKKPHKHPFYVSPKTIDRLSADLETSARICQAISMGLFAISSILLIMLLSLGHEVVYEVMCSFFTNNLQKLYKYLCSFFTLETLSTWSKNLVTDVLLDLPRPQ